MVPDLDSSHKAAVYQHCTMAQCNLCDSPKDVKQWVMADPEVQQIMSDPPIQLILEQVLKDPQLLSKHLKKSVL
jgi:hypothetical protein